MRRSSLLWNLLGITVLVVGIAVGLAALTIGRLADVIFANLMQEFHVKADVLHQRFVSAMTLSLVLASVAAAGAGLLLSLVLFRRVVDRIRRMMTMAQRIASGDYAARAEAGSGDEVDRLAASLNQMAQSLETLERLRKDLVANVAHELRTPLANLRGYLEALHDGVTSASPEIIAGLHDEVMRLVRLVDALHELSRLDARLPHSRRQPVDLNVLIRRVVDLRQEEFAAKGISVDADVSLQPGTAQSGAQGDPDLLMQAIHNLVDNALKFTPQGGRVHLRVTVDGAPARARLEVTNTGEGIGAEDLPFIFERFYRGEKSRSRASGGAGIGLAIVKEIARVHGGEVGARSNGGETTVWFTLPSGDH